MFTRPAGEFIEHMIPRGSYKLAAREYRGSKRAFIMMHGFPDDQKIWSRLAPVLAGMGHRVITLDFLGYGASDKPPAFPYSAKAWEEDLDAAISSFKADRPIVVGHDASGPTALNWALDNDDRIGGVGLLNMYYGAAPTLKFPYFIAFFADPNYREMSIAALQDPAIFTWIMDFQRQLFVRDIPEEQAALAQWLTPSVRPQFAATPSAAIAFSKVTAGLHDSVEANTKRHRELATLKKPTSLIWGTADRFLNLGVAEHLMSFLPNATLTTLKAGHWPQITMVDGVAKELAGLAAKAS
jgi:pimeloyl-ACP methyl ester carboxylesterase